MDKQIIPVPAMIRYIGFWKEFCLSNFKGQHVIINKQLTGCGFTEYVLRCNLPSVLSSPRRMLMQNKKEQHGEDVFLVVNESLDDLQSSLDYDPQEKLETKGKISKEEEMLGLALEEYSKNYESIYEKIKDGLYKYLQRLPQGKSPKIIVTYDSTYIVKKILEEWGLLDQFYFVVDEFQSILDDSRFKAGTELEFLNVLQEVPNVTFVSATPMLDKYLAMLDEFKDLPYYELDWGQEDPRRVQKPTLKIRGYKSLIGEMKDIINSYLQGDFQGVVVERDGQLVNIESKEAVFYVNSVNHIIRIIKSMELDPSLVNILCSDTPENQRKIEKKLGKKKGYKIGSVPTYGQPHKMFTFCTRTVYLGADFYSTNARSFIFSDSNSDCLSIDISMDLPQILGRQRLDENPWKNSAEFFYRSTCDYKKMTFEDLMRLIERKEEKTNNLLSSYHSSLTQSAKDDLADTYKLLALVLKYKDNYVSVDRKSGNTLVPCFNNLVKVNDLRTFEIQQIDYADRFTVLTAIDNQFQELREGENEYVMQFFKQYSSLTTYVDRLQFACEFLLQFPEATEGILMNLKETDKIRQHILALGPDKCKSLGYNLTRINQTIGIIMFDRNLLDREIYSKFNPGDKYSKADLKNILKNIYENTGYKATPKANDIGNWFEIKQIQFSNKETGKRDMGFELLSVKQ